jgi:hypothetical protein
MQCKEFASVIENQGLLPLPDAAQVHLASCTDCQGLLADFGSIVDAAKQLPSEVDPPQRIWVSLRAQLEAEGLIKESAILIPESPAIWLQNVQALFRPRALATAGVGIALAIAAFLQLHKPVNPANSIAPVAVRQTQPEVPKAAPVQPIQVAEQQAKPQVSLPVQQLPSKSVAPVNPPDEPVLVASPSEDVYFARSAALNQAEHEVSSSRLAGNPALDESLRKNLKTVNAFIAECEAHLKKHPQDTLAREYLNSAYQQKAELLAAMLDSGRSEQ